MLSRSDAPVERQRGLSGEPEDEHSRYLECEVAGLIVASIYLPNGNPIPGLAYLGVDLPPVAETHADLIGADVAARRGGRYEVRRIIEIVQNQPGVMDRLHRGGVVPGAVLEFGTRGLTLVVTDDGISTDLPADIAHGIHVRPAA